jgi:hypothetical protein
MFASEHAAWIALQLPFSGRMGYSIRQPQVQITRLDSGKKMLASAITAGGMKISPIIAYPPPRPPFGIPIDANAATAISIHGMIIPYARDFNRLAPFPGPITRLTSDLNSLPQFGHVLGRSLGHGRSNMYFCPTLECAHRRD